MTLLEASASEFAIWRADCQDGAVAKEKKRASSGKAAKLGERLRSLREKRGISLREMERRSGINSGYLSQLERDEIAQPTPSVLNRIAEPYGEPVEVLMEWAGYINADPKALSPNRKRALNFIPDDISERELEALRAVLDALRGDDSSANSLLRGHRYDMELLVDEKKRVKATAKALLRTMDADRSSEAVDLEQAMSVAKLVEAGEIKLDLAQKRKLRERFGGLVDWALKNLQGLVNLDSNEVFVKPGMHESRRRFVLAHEIGHAALEDHRIVFAHLDDKKRLHPEFADRLECQANQFSIELLAKGDRFCREFDGSPPSIERLALLSGRYRISLQAAARRVAEGSRQECAVALAWRTNKGSGPLYLSGYKLWTSASFERRFGWRTLGHPGERVKAALRGVVATAAPDSFLACDGDGDEVQIGIDGLDAHYSVLALFVPPPRVRVRSLNPLRKGSRSPSGIAAA
jgi:HTH-type transcriptional regulator, competence development regulator